LVARNSAALVTPPRIIRKRIEPLDPKSARELLKVARGSRFEPIYVTTLTLGLRRGEVLGLRWSDVDLDQRTLHISQSLQRLLTGSDVKGKKSALQATETKTDGSRRSIALPDSVIRALKARRVKQAEERLAAGAEWKDYGLVFTTATGRAVEPKVLHREYKSLLKKAASDHSAIS
jgi:integrase